MSTFITHFPKNSAKMRLFCFPPAGGSASEFKEWGAYLPSDIEVVSIQLPGRETRFSENAITHFNTLIDILFLEICDLINIPFAFFGHSLGGLVAYELTHYLYQKDASLPELLIISAKEAPHCHTLPSAQDIINNAWLLERLKKYNSISPDLLSTTEFQDVFLPYIRSDFLVLASYEYHELPKLNLPIVVLHGKEDYTTNPEKIKAWESYTTKSFEFKEFSGGHFFIRETNDKLLAYISKRVQNLQNDTGLNDNRQEHVKNHLRI